MGKNFDLLEQEWNNLIILDACRYDYFEEVYSKYLEGDLKKITSPAFETTQWLRNTFGGTKHEDIIYVSGNPYVNTEGIESDRFDARGKFFKVVDVWSKGWEEELKTVPPEKVTKAARRMRAKYPGKRLVIHYMQPHYPFISLGPVKGLASPQQRKEEGSGLISKLRRKVTVLIQRYIGPGAFLIFSEANRLLFSLSPHAVELVAREYGKEKLREAYRENLEIALESVTELVEVLPGKSVISADHGYLLGEDDEYAQESLLNGSLLFEIPWFEVEKAK